MHDLPIMNLNIESVIKISYCRVECFNNTNLIIVKQRHMNTPTKENRVADICLILFLTSHQQSF